MRRGLGGYKNMDSAPSGGEEALTVSALTRQIKNTLEGGFDRISVKGEIGNLTFARSGHLYLSLKDANALIDVVMWRNAASRLSFTPKEGDQVVARGEISVYEPRGRYQLVASSLKPEGKGDLQSQFEELVKKLRDEGLFLPEHKRPIPEKPSTVGIVTSATGAAVRDIIKVLKRRAPGVRIVVSPCSVQGEAAPAEIVNALEKLDSWGECDTIIVGRGGGSLEDLWAFNTEIVARAVFVSSTPVISAVGHEVDVSVCDLVADYRAATPSEAAEAAVPDMQDTSRELLRLRRALSQALLSRVREAKQAVQSLKNHPVFRRPQRMIDTRRQVLDEVVESLTASVTRLVEKKKDKISMAAARLEALSPLGVLARGYSVTLDKASGKVLRDASEIKTDDEITSVLARGKVLSRVISVEEDNGEKE